MRGGGARWDAIQQLFRLQCRRLGLACDARGDGEPDEREPEPAARQGELFPGGTAKSPGKAATPGGERGPTSARNPATGVPPLA
jgi:hypothetical protein